MIEDFFARPILNSPYAYPGQHWELDTSGQPTNRIIDSRRLAEFITPIPKPKKRKKSKQQELIYDEGAGLSTAAQKYDPTPIINEIRRLVDDWRTWPNPPDWKVTPETQRLLQHWRHHDFQNLRPFFCQTALSGNGLITWRGWPGVSARRGVFVTRGCAAGAAKL